MIKGKLIGLRAVEKQDLEFFRNWRNLPHFRKNFREVRELSSVDQGNWFDSLSKTRHINFMFTIVRLEDDNPIGAAGLLYTNWLNRATDFSFYIGEDEMYMGDNGYAEEGVKLLIDYGFNNLNLNKIWMELYEFDYQKIEFFTKKFNFKQDGLLRQNCFEDGKYWDSLIISLLRDE